MVRYLDRGAMAYLLATPNSRTRIALTMVGVMVTILVALMAVVTALEAGFAEALFSGELDMQALMQVNAGLLALWLAMAGLCFLSACLFSNATAALWVGGCLLYTAAPCPPLRSSTSASDSAMPSPWTT